MPTGDRRSADVQIFQTAPCAVIEIIDICKRKHLVVSIKKLLAAVEPPFGCVREQMPDLCIMMSLMIPRSSILSFL